jgi:hypothetical protein
MALHNVYLLCVPDSTGVKPLINNTSFLSLIFDSPLKFLLTTAVHLSRVGVTYKAGLGLDDWIYCTLYIHTVRDYRQYSSIAILHTFQFTATHALGFSVFTSRILATDFSQSHWHFKSHMETSFHSLIHFLSFLLSHLRLPSPELDQILDN